MGSVPPASTLLKEETLLRPLDRAVEPDTAAGLITAMKTPRCQKLLNPKTVHSDNNLKTKRHAALLLYDSHRVTETSYDAFLLHYLKQH